MPDRHVAMGSNGRLVIPAEVRTALGMENGGAFVLHVDDEGVLQLEPMRRVIARVQEEVSQYVPQDADLVQELAADRRQEAHHNSCRSESFLGIIRNIPENRI